MIRLFAALQIPDDVARDLKRRQQGLPGARWRPPEALHVTLRFFGEMSERKASDLDAELARIAESPLEIVLEGAGAFSEGGRQTSVWAGVAENPALRRLAEKCEAAARRSGLEPDRRTYRPHVTLAYLRRADERRVAAWIQNHNLLKSPPIRITWFGLWSSWLSQDGSRYELEQEYPLR